MFAAYQGTHQLKSWVKTKKTNVATNKRLSVLSCDPAMTHDAIAEVAAIVPDHYASSMHLARVLERLGKDAAAKLLIEKMPTGKSIRSGDLGEILGATYVAEFTRYGTGVNRLRWKDHREMAMRGDDIVAVRIKSNGEPRFLKGEAKSNVKLSKTTVRKAREALRSHNNRPSGHALTFLASQLHSEGTHDLADVIDEAQLVDGIALRQVTHMVFTFSGNDPTTILTNDLKSYRGRVRQTSVGIKTDEHQEFIKAVFEKVSVDGEDD